MNEDAASAFAQSYREAREKFLAAADAAGLDAHARVHPLLGRDGETLAIDAVRDGAADAQALLLISSGCHGVEGYCGSGAQVALLRDRDWLDAVRASGVALLYLHALNPWGFSWCRRTTHENIDLNRNFHDFGRPLPRNDAYDAIAHRLVPALWPPPVEAEHALQAYAAQHGERALQFAVCSGQHAHPQGLFFGGVGPSWSNLALRGLLREHARRCRRLAWIDVHSGLGPRGHGERIFIGPDDALALARAREWWGADVTSPEQGTSSAVAPCGPMWRAAIEECTQSGFTFTGIGLEFGTLPLADVIDALRADQWLENHPELSARRAAIKRRLRDAFYIDADDWKRSVVAQTLDCAQRALRGLGRPQPER